MRNRQLLGVLSIALFPSLALCAPPPYGEPFFKLLGTDTVQNGNHGSDTVWEVIETDVKGWAKHFYGWSYVGATKEYTYAEGNGPGYHRVIKVYLSDEYWRGPDFPYINDPCAPLVFVYYDVGYPHIDITSTMCEDPPIVP